MINISQIKNKQNESKKIKKKKDMNESNEKMLKKKKQKNVNITQPDGIKQQLKKKKKKILKKEKQPKQICNFFIHGSCHKGNECSFSHDAEQIKKTELCKYFLTGNCAKGDECLFSHDTRLFPCKFFQGMGYCKEGDNCRLV